MKMNFKTIKDLSSNLLLENVISTANNGFSYKKFINEIKSSPILKTQFIVYTNIENESFKDKSTAELFLNENLSFFNSYTKKEILTENEKIMSKFFKNNVNENVDKLFELILESAKDRKINNIAYKATLFVEIINKLMEEKVVISEDVNPVIDNTLPLKKVIKRATEILNEKYSFLNEEELNILKSFINNDDSTKKELYTKLVTENLKLVKRKLFENDNFEQDELDSLNLTEEKLKNLEYNSEILIGEYSKLIELKNTLQ